MLLWERACSRWDRRGYSDKPRRLHREQARSHKGVAFTPVKHPRRFRSLAPFSFTPTPPDH
ncbi:hypothetical protein CJU73_05025 [Pseudomonas fragi]|nr:hypothetical protein CJU73_05025 [Pseudomonas fragi]